MAQAPTYNRTTGFADDERANSGGRTAVRADRLDAELDAAATSINALRTNQALLQRDDGQLKDRVVTPEALSAAAVMMLGGSKFTPRGAWASGMTVSALDLVERNGASFVALVAHIAGSFDTDRAAGKWQLFPGQPTASDTSFSPTTNTPQTNVQTAIDQAAADLRARTAATLAYSYGAL
jgi:hypothetical protein